MKRGDKIIWDSDFGYEIGYFRSVEGGVYNTYQVDLFTGCCQDDVSLPQNEIHPYSDELVRELTKKYGYEKAFSKLF